MPSPLLTARIWRRRLGFEPGSNIAKRSWVEGQKKTWVQALTNCATEAMWSLALQGYTRWKRWTQLYSFFSHFSILSFLFDILSNILMKIIVIQSFSFVFYIVTFFNSLKIKQIQWKQYAVEPDNCNQISCRKTRQNYTLIDTGFVIFISQLIFLAPLGYTAHCRVQLIGCALKIVQSLCALSGSAKLYNVIR